MKEKILNQKQKSLWAKLTGVKEVSGFYMAGGTALALQLGHRESVDFDFFSDKSKSTENIIVGLKKLGGLTILDQSNDHLNAILNGVKVSYFHYPYTLIAAAHNHNGMLIADIKDILPMKLIAVSQRGVKKDFIDIFEAINVGWSIEAIFELLPIKFPGVSYSKTHILKGLTFFDDAEADEMPKMFTEASWDDIKRRLRAEVKKIIVR